MADGSHIEWTDATWNPVRGCSRVSPGCGGANHEGGCYAEKIAARFSGPGQPFEGFARRTPNGGQWTGKLAVVETALDLPLRWQWARGLRDQCACAGVPFFFKQWGEWAPAGSGREGDPGRYAFGDYECDGGELWPGRFIEVDGYPRRFTMFGARALLKRVGKKAAGRLLDGREWSEFPA